MPEAAAWQFKDVKRVPAKRSPDEIVARGRVFTGDSDSAIDDGFVRIEKGKIMAVGAASDLGSGAEGALVVGGPGQDRPPRTLQQSCAPSLGWSERSRRPSTRGRT